MRREVGGDAPAWLVVEGCSIPVQQKLAADSPPGRPSWGDDAGILGASGRVGRVDRAMCRDVTESVLKVQHGA